MPVPKVSAPGPPKALSGSIHGVLIWARSDVKKGNVWDDTVFADRVAKGLIRNSRCLGATIESEIHTIANQVEMTILERCEKIGKLLNDLPST